MPSKFKGQLKKGFSLAEVILVIVIITILTAVGATELVRWQNKLERRELNAIAREMFIVSQNHLTRAAEQNYFNAEASGSPNPYGIPDEDDSDIYYVVYGSESVYTRDNSVLNHMLPVGSIDETVIDDGNFVIEYRLSTGTVQNVFYAENDGKYAFDLSGLQKTEATRSFASYLAAYNDSNNYIGFYGADSSASAISELSEIQKPTLFVNNGNKLEVTINNPNTSPIGDGKYAQLKLCVKGAKSGEVKYIDLVDSDGNLITNQGFTVNGTTGQITICLDDISSEDGHFANLFPDFIPGEDISLQVIAYSDEGLTNIAESGTKTVNSLFADYDYDEGTDTGTAHVTNLRHLQNLSETVSGANLNSGGDSDPTNLKITKVVQDSDIDWSDFGGGSGVVTSLDGTVTSDTFIPLNPSGAFEYDGNSKKIIGLEVETTGTDEGAGLFGDLDAGSYIHDLELVDFDVTSTDGNAGALAATVTGSIIENVIAYNSDDSSDKEITGKDNVGGLVGELINSTINGSAAAVYVKSTGGNAGGLVGESDNSTITASYAGGHTKDRAYLDELTGDCRINVQAPTGSSSSDSGNGGGLIGYSVNTNISDSYSTCSASGTRAGGFIGNASGGKLTDCYSTGLVSDKSGTKDPFANGTISALSSELTFAAGVNDTDTSKTGASSFTLPDSLDGDPAYPYDPTLGLYCYETVAELLGYTKGSAEYNALPDFLKSHYGDWPVDINSICIKFYANTGNAADDAAVINLPPTTYYISGDTVTLSSQAPSRPGKSYAFKGWAKNDPLKTTADYQPGAVFVIVDSIDLYAIWQVQPYYIDIKVQLDGLDNTTDLSSHISVKDASGNVTGVSATDTPGVYRAYVDEGTYTVLYDGADAGLSSVTITDSPAESDVLQLYTLSAEIYKDGVLWTGDGAPTVEKFVRVNNSVDKVPLLTKTGETSIVVPKGSTWQIYVEKDGVSYLYHTESGISKTKPIEISYYTLTFDTNAASKGLDASQITLETVPDSTVLLVGSNYEIPALPVYGDGTEWGCIGWNTKADGTGDMYFIGESFQLVNTSTLYAVWSDQKYTITYHMNFYDTSGNLVTTGAPVDNTNYLSGTYAVIAGNTNNISRAGYYFVGWNTEKDGTGNMFLAGDRVPMTRDLVLYAQWAPTGTYTIIYEKNGATGGEIENTWIFVDTSVRVTLNKNGFTRADYMFMGWADSAVDEYEGGAATWTYTDGQVLSSAEEIETLKQIAVAQGGASNYIIKLYAVWQYRTSYSVMFHLNHMDKGDSPEIAYLGEDYSATLTCVGGYNPPSDATEISVYVDFNRNGLFGDGEKLEKLIAHTEYEWDAYNMTLTIPGEYVQGNIKIVASASAGKHTISYYSNFKTSGTDTVNCTDEDDAETTFITSAQYTYGVYITLPDGPERTGYVFKGWNTECDGSGDNYPAGEAYLVEHTQKLYAQWKKTEIVGAYIYNYFIEYKTSDTSAEYLKQAKTSRVYTLLQGETQTTADGETYLIQNNGGEPYANESVSSSSYTFYYAVKLPKGSVLGSEYKVYIKRTGDSSYTDITTSAGSGYSKLTSGWFKMTSFLAKWKNGSSDATANFASSELVTDLRYPNGDSAGGTTWDGSSSNPGDDTDIYDYYYFYVTNSASKTSSSGYIPELEEIKIENVADNTVNKFVLINSSRPQNSYMAMGTVSGSGQLGITGAAPQVIVRNGNVPTLNRSVAYFYKQAGCQADFTVKPSENGYTFNFVSLQNEDDQIVTTQHQLYSVSGSTYTFNTAALNELEPGEYTVTMHYNNYAESPSFKLTVYSEFITGYRYVKMQINSVSDNKETNPKVQFSEITFAADEDGVALYKFEDTARVYDISDDVAYYHEDAYLCIDNNVRTKYCSVDSTYSSGTKGSWTLILDCGDGYQMNVNLYGYISYTTAGDTWSYGRSPMNFDYYGSNDSSVMSSKSNANASTGWTQFTDFNLTNTYSALASSSRPGYSAIESNETYLDNYSYVLNETMVKPQHNIYSLTYNTNGGSSDSGSSWTGISNHYGDVVVTYEIPEKTGYYFCGWSESANAVEADYQSGEHFNLIYNATLYAVWSDTSPIFCISYHPNLPSGKTSSDVATFPNNSYVTAGANKVSTVKPTLSGYKFREWEWRMTYRDTDGIDKTKLVDSAYQYGNPLTYTAGDSIPNVKSNMQLYATWTEGYTVTLPEEKGFTITNPSTRVNDVNKGASFSFTIAAKTGWEITSVTAKDNISGAVTTLGIGDGTFTINNVTSDYSVSIDVKAAKFTVTVATDGHCTVERQGTYAWDTSSAKEYKAQISYGGSLGYIITPDSGYGVTGATNSNYDKNVSGSYYYSVQNVTANVTANVTLSQDTYTIRFNTNYGGSGTDTFAYQTVVVGSSAELAPNTFDKGTGYIFAGWSETADGSVQYADEASVNFACSKGDVKDLYAVWQSGWYIRFHDFTNNLWKKLSVNKGGSLTAPAYTESDVPTGYTFGGWVTNSADAKNYTGSSNKASFSSVSADMDVYAAADPKNYSLTLKKADGDGNYTITQDTAQVTYDSSSVSYASGAYTVPDDRTGYTFAGWTKTAGGSDVVINTAAPGVLVSGTDYVTDDRAGGIIWTHDSDENLYASWTANTYDATLMNGSSVFTVIHATYDSHMATFDGPTMTGYKLTGWHLHDTTTQVITVDSDGRCNFISGQLVDSDGDWVTDHNVVIDADWKGYKLTLSSIKGGANKTKDYDNLSYNTANTLSGAGTTAYDFASDWARTGWKLEGWYTKSSGGTQILDAAGNVVSGSNVTGYTSGGNIALTADRTLYAHWTRKFKVVLQSTNGGVNAVQLPGTSDGYYYSGDSVSALASTYSTGMTKTVTGQTWTFAGWYTAADDDGIETFTNLGNPKTSGTYIDASGKWSITDDSESELTITLYAKWDVVEEKTIYIAKSSTLTANSTYIIVATNGTGEQYSLDLATDATGDNKHSNGTVTVKEGGKETFYTNSACTSVKSTGQYISSANNTSKWLATSSGSYIVLQSVAYPGHYMAGHLSGVNEYINITTKISDSASNRIYMNYSSNVLATKKGSYNFKWTGSAFDSAVGNSSKLYLYESTKVWQKSTVWN